MKDLDDRIMDIKLVAKSHRDYISKNSEESDRAKILLTHLERAVIIMDELRKADPAKDEDRENAGSIPDR